MMHLNEEVTKELIKTTDALRKKYKALRNGKAAFDLQIEEVFKPITKPLKDLVEKSNIKNSFDDHYNNFASPHKKIKQNYEEDEFITPNNTTTTSNISDSTPKTSMVTPQSKRDRSSRLRHRHLVRDFEEKIDLGTMEKIPRDYINLYLNNSRTLDDLYGVHLNNGMLQIGDKELKIKGNDIEINNKIYNGTPGLFELVFKKKPTQFNDEDLINYKTILLATNAHKRNHSPGSQVLGNKGYKYKQIINKLFEDKTIIDKPIALGNGLM